MKIKIEFFKNDFINAIGAGVYEIDVSKQGKTKALYIGESAYVLGRCSKHLYELKKQPYYFGFNEDTIEDEEITMSFKLLKAEKNKKKRKKIELAQIKEKKPLSQEGINDYQKKVKDKKEALANFLQSC